MTPPWKRTVVGFMIAAGTFLVLRGADVAASPDASLDEIRARLTAKDLPTALPPFDLETDRFVESPPPGFTEEEYRAAVRQSLLDEIDRRADSVRSEGNDPDTIKRTLLEAISREGGEMDGDARGAAAALWYSRTPAADIPPPPVSAERAAKRDMPWLLWHHFLFYGFTAGMALASNVVVNRQRRQERH